jgi:hypothetical protein
MMTNSTVDSAEAVSSSTCEANASSVFPVVSAGNSKLKHYTKAELERENFDLVAKVTELLDDHDLWSDDGTYTFKDGERWAVCFPGEIQT